MLALLFILLTANIQLFSCSTFDLRAIKTSVKGPKIIPNTSGEEYRPIGTMNPNLEESIEPISTLSLISLKSSKTAEPSTPASKRARNNSTTFPLSPDMTPEHIINRELNSCGYRTPQRKQIFREALEAIAANDLDKFEGLKGEFLAVFKLKYLNDFERFGMKEYLMRFMVLFGADKFFPSYGNLSNYHDDLVSMDILKYLIDTKPLDVVLNTLVGFNKIIFNPEMITETKNILNEKYPQMNFIRKFALTILRPYHLDLVWTRNFLSAKSDLEAFKEISSILNQVYHLKKDFYSLALENPELYVQCTSKEKFQFILLIISTDDLESFEAILNLDLEMIGYLSEDYSPLFRANYDYLNLMKNCIDKSAIKCFTFLLQIVPEMMEIPKKFPCTLCRLVYSQKPIFLDLILSNGYSVDSLILDKDGKKYSLVQFAFMNSILPVLTYFVSKVEEERIRSSIKTIFCSKESIVKHVIEQAAKGRINLGIIDFMLDVLKINPYDKYSYQGKTGNILIFLDQETRHLKVKLFRP